MSCNGSRPVAGGLVYDAQTMSAHLSTTSGGSGLTYWRKRLANTELPVTSSLETLQELASPELSSPRLLEALNHDLPLGLALLMEGQRSIPSGGRVSGLSHAVGVLGQRRIQALVTRLARFRLDPNQPGHQQLAEALMTSRLAGHLAMQFAAAEKNEEAQLKAWASQVQIVAQWKLAIAAPDVAQALKQRTDQGERDAHAERALLGCRLHELNAAVALDMGLLDEESSLCVKPIAPHMLRHASRLAWIDVRPPEIPTEVGRWLFQPSTLPSLVQMLAHEAMRDWYSPRTTMVLKILSAHRHKRFDELLGLTRQAALAASREHNLHGIVAPPAVRLLRPPAVRVRQGLKVPDTAARPALSPGALKRPAAAPVGPSVSKPVRQVVAAPTPALKVKPVPTHSAHSLVQRFIDDCTQARHPDLPSFFKAFDQALTEELQLGRFALFLKTSRNAHLVCYLARGFGPAVVPKQLTVSLSDNNLLARLFAQPHGFLMVEPGRVHGVRPQLPEPLRAELRPCGALWGAVQVHDRSIGVLWADARNPGAVVNAVQYASFKRLTRHFGVALTRLMKAQSTTAAKPS